MCLPVCSGSDSGVFDTEGRYVPQRFEELMSKYDKDNKGGLTYKVSTLLIQKA